MKNEYISYHLNELRPLVYLSWSNTDDNSTWQGDTDYSNLRYYEMYYYSIDDFVCIFDLRSDTRLSALLSIIQTIYICIILALGAVYFSNDAERLVIKPIEAILIKVKKIAKNPIASSDLRGATLASIQQKKSCFCCEANNENNAEFETKIIEQTIIKIGILLALGFGEAGSEIIGSNIKQGGEVDPMISGNKIVAIFGFCDIRNFTDTTEELQEGVMMFVNEIAQVVHGIVDKYFGSANKNIGDAFLLV